MIQSFLWIMESIYWQLAQNDFRPVFLTAACADSPSAKRSGGWERWYEGWTTLENQHVVLMQRAFPAESAGMSFFSETALQGK